MFSFLKKLFGVKDDDGMELNGSERYLGAKYRYQTDRKTGERVVTVTGKPVDEVVFAPPDCKIADLRKSVKPQGDAWNQSKEYRSRSK